MVVGDDRQRYIAFIIEGGDTDRGGMIDAIRSEFSRKEYEEIKPWLTVFKGDKGIIRCKHTGKEKAVKILSDMTIKEGKVKTITTSGTIKKAKKRLYDYG
ncbi:MAG: Rpp14/Pop5 family protein [Candidatus Thermoplasmatota archaeon]